jgi:hypothetical protein
MKLRELDIPRYLLAEQNIQLFGLLTRHLHLCLPSQNTAEYTAVWSAYTTLAPLSAIAK